MVLIDYYNEIWKKCIADKLCKVQNTGEEGRRNFRTLYGYKQVNEHVNILI